MKSPMHVLAAIIVALAILIAAFSLIFIHDGEIIAPWGGQAIGGQKTAPGLPVEDDKTSGGTNPNNKEAQDANVSNGSGPAQETQRETIRENEKYDDAPAVFEEMTALESINSRLENAIDLLEHFVVAFNPDSPLAFSDPGMFSFELTRGPDATGYLFKPYADGTIPSELMMAIGENGDEVYAMLIPTDNLTNAEIERLYKAALYILEYRYGEPDVWLQRTATGGSNVGRDTYLSDFARFISEERDVYRLSVQWNAPRFVSTLELNLFLEPDGNLYMLISGYR